MIPQHPTPIDESTIMLFLMVLMEHSDKEPMEPLLFKLESK